MEIIDQMGRSLHFDQSPVRIVSLVPSQTELLVDLRLRENILGLTKFCCHPKGLIKEKVVVGGTKQIRKERIAALKPDIILCNKEENTKAIVEELSDLAPVHVSDIKNIEDALALINLYGVLFNRQEEGSSLVQSIRAKMALFTQTIGATDPKPSVGYLIWKDPFMVAGNDTFIDYLLGMCGFRNAFSRLEGRYPEITLVQLKDLDHIFLSSEPYPFSEKHMVEFQKYTQAKISLVDGEYFSWYGSRLNIAFEYFASLREALIL